MSFKRQNSAIQEWNKSTKIHFIYGKNKTEQYEMSSEIVKTRYLKMMKRTKDTKRNIGK